MSTLLPVPGAPSASLHQVCFSYGQQKVLTEISLDIALGDFLAVIGPNGGGKTTLLYLLLGFLAPQKGTVRLFGHAPASMRRYIGYVPQYSTLEPDFPATVLELALMGGAVPSLFGGRWGTGEQEKKKALHYLDILGLKKLAGHSLAGLSGGQRQRALVARALMGRPDDAPEAPFILLLDEPTASIDPKGKFCFYEFLHSLRGVVTIVVVSHDLTLASPFFTTVAVVNNDLTLVPEGQMTPAGLNALFGSHRHHCPVGNLQHAAGAQHDSDCTHATCLGDDT